MFYPTAKSAAATPSNRLSAGSLLLEAAIATCVFSLVAATFPSLFRAKPTALTAITETYAPAQTQAAIGLQPPLPAKTTSTFN